MNQELHINDDVLVKYLLGEALQEEALAVETWLQASAENNTYYIQLKKIWEQSLDLAPQIQIDEKEAWQRFQQSIAAIPVKEKTKPASLFNLSAIKWMAAAAVVILITSGLKFLLNERPEPAIAMMEKTTLSEITKDTLQDGSVITLNKNTKLSYPEKFTGESRPVSLKGEAFFEVKPDKSKPFVIAANDVTITVVGTSFNVKNYDSTTEVIVESGIVRISYLNQSVELFKGEKITVKNNQPNLEKNQISNSLYNYYRTGIIDCNVTTLKALIGTLNQAFEVNIVLAKPSLENLQITAVFENENIDTILDIVCATLDLSVSNEGNNYLIDSK